VTELLALSAEDFCCFEAFTLPLLRQGLVWLGGDNQDSDAAESNGSGKSTIFKALSWGIYGETIDGEKGDKVIRNGTKCARVVIRMTEDWRVIRERRKGSPRLWLYRGEEEYKADKADVQTKINELVGMDFRSFRNTVLYGQRDRSRFVDPSTSDADRKRVLHHILRTEVLRTCHDIAKKRNLALVHEIADLEEQIRTVTARIEEHDLEGLREESRAWEESRQSRAEAAAGHARALVARAKEIGREAPDKKELAKRIEEIDRKLLLCERATEKADRLRDEADRLATELSEARGVEYAAGAAVSDLEARLAALGGSERCPTCNSPLGKGEAAAHIHEMEGEVFRLNGKAEAAKDRANAIEAAADEKREAADAMERKARAKFELTRERGRVEMAIARAETISTLVKDASEAARLKIAEVKEIKAEANPYETRIAKAVAIVKKHRATIRDARGKLREKATDRAHEEFWVKGFSPAGLPSFLLDSTMPYLTERANHYLDGLADGDIQMGFSTQRELKSAKGEYRDEIDIRWTIEGVEGYPPSGGQFKKMEIATDLALMDLAATREGGHLDLLCLDECLDGLDSEGRSRIIHLLQGLRKSRGTIYVISHDPGVAEAFERALVVTKRDGIARLEAA